VSPHLGLSAGCDSARLLKTSSSPCLKLEPRLSSFRFVSDSNLILATPKLCRFESRFDFFTAKIKACVLGFRYEPYFLMFRCMISLSHIYKRICGHTYLFNHGTIEIISSLIGLLDKLVNG